MSDVRPRKGGPYSLYCYSCRRWIPNTANHEMSREGFYSHSHFCYVEDGEIVVLSEPGVEDKECKEVWPMYKKTAYQLLRAVDDKLQLVESDLRNVISRLEDFITDNKHREEGFDNWMSEIWYAIEDIRDILSQLGKP